MIAFLNHSLPQAEREAHFPHPLHSYLLPRFAPPSFLPPSSLPSDDAVRKNPCGLDCFEVGGREAAGARAERGHLEGHQIPNGGIAAAWPRPRHLSGWLTPPLHPSPASGDAPQTANEVQDCGRQGKRPVAQWVTTTVAALGNTPLHSRGLHTNLQ